MAPKAFIKVIKENMPISEEDNDLFVYHLKQFLNDARMTKIDKEALILLTQNKEDGANTH